ncbi:hypothetical protein MKX78_01420 [Cytobacillus sp. FSL R5-0569]|uniref:hypothetical protein n=1 Tax=Cytobacillus sp. FSL R5-0569 TaxID=2921649 RepID=UPI0030F9EDA2
MSNQKYEHKSKEKREEVLSNQRYLHKSNENYKDVLLNQKCEHSKADNTKPPAKIKLTACFNKNLNATHANALTLNQT